VAAAVGERPATTAVGAVAAATWAAMIISSRATISLLQLHVSPFFYSFLFFLTGFLFFINNCFFCRPSDSTVLKDAEIEPSTVVALALADSSVADP
jgi:hypothetical protein